MRRPLLSFAIGLLVLGTSPSAAADAAYLACDNGLRCLKAPCPSTTVRDLATGREWKGTSPDISGLSEVEQQRIRETDALYFGRLVLRGHIEEQAGALSTLVITGILREAKVTERRQCPKG